MDLIGQIQFPEYKGIRCNMMPFIQGDSSSLPEEYKSYSEIIDSHFLEKGEIGFLTIDERFVDSGKSQRGFNSMGIDRNVHIEVGKCFLGNRWGNGWRGESNVLLEDETEILIANNIDDTCMVWNTEERGFTPDGDLSHIIDKYPRDKGVMMKSGDLYRIGIFTPHECINQKTPANRQFLRIVGKGITGRENYFTKNHLLN